jgi:hypothetical protein
LTRSKGSLEDLLKSSGSSVKGSVLPDSGSILSDMTKKVFGNPFATKRKQGTSRRSRGRRTGSSGSSFDFGNFGSF